MNIKFAVSIVSTCLLFSSTCLGATYSITDIGAFHPWGINNNGQVIGYLNVDILLWDSTNGLRDIGRLGGGTGGRPLDINNAGQVTGWSYVGVNKPHAFIWSSSGGMVDLGTLSGDSISEGRAIDQNGNVYGISVDAHRVQKVFKWVSGSGMVDLAFPLQSGIDKLYANDAGQIAGTYSTSTGFHHGFFWDKASGLHDLGTFGGPNSYVCGIDSSGQVLGSANLTPSGDSRAFLWDSSHGMQDIGSFGPSGISDLGQVAGQFSYYIGDEYVTRPCLWTVETGRVELPTLGDGNSYTSAINDTGQIVGWSIVSPGVYHSFLWTTVPEPSSLLALAGGIAGLGGIALRRKRR